MANIGFIGLGNMGGPMAANLVRAGHMVTGFDLVPAALQAARAAGVVIADTAAAASGQCWSLTTYCPVPGPVPTSPANGGYKPGFAAALMLKDLKLSQEAANASGARTALGAHAAEIYASFEEAGQGGVDFSGIINAIRERSRT